MIGSWVVSLPLPLPGCEGPDLCLPIALIVALTSVKASWMGRCLASGWGSDADATLMRANASMAWRRARPHQHDFLRLDCLRVYFFEAALNTAKYLGGSTFALRSRRAGSASTSGARLYDDDDDVSQGLSVADGDRGTACHLGCRFGPQLL